MKYIDEYRNAELAKTCIAAIKDSVSRDWTIMEVCGGQTHSIVRFGIQDLLPKTLKIVHGPGCPVCVTPVEMIDKAHSIAARDEVIFCSFGDMLRVPGSHADLSSVRAHGGDVRIVYTPLDAVKIAAENPHKQVVFFAVGFETTAPANALAVHTAKSRGLENFSMLVSQVLVPPALTAIMASPDNRIQAYLAAGHVCAVMGTNVYKPLAEKYGVPIVVTGFEPLDILQGIHMCVQQLESGRAVVENQYARAVRDHGNQHAQALLEKVFRIVSRDWRGIGEIQDSGWALAAEYQDFDAEKRFDCDVAKVAQPAACLSGDVLQGLKKPGECPAFGKQCTPDHPLGATMVSAEGACAAYFRYRHANVA